MMGAFLYEILWKGDFWGHSNPLFTLLASYEYKNNGIIFDKNIKTGGFLTPCTVLQQTL